MIVICVFCFNFFRKVSGLLVEDELNGFDM